MSLTVVLATRNRGKIREIRAILAALDIELLESSDVPPFAEPAEDGETFLENAAAKAKAVHRATGYPSLADDSGLEVDALGGAPGVRSARYGGPGLTDADRCAKLLEELRGVRDEERSARFQCAVVLYPAPGSARKGLAAEGYLYGRIVRSPRGTGGFGYDPVFLVPERGMTLAEMDPVEKNAISHRYRALVELKHMLMRDCGIAARR